MIVKYHASGHFDIETEIEMPEAATGEEILISIISQQPNV